MKISPLQNRVDPWGKLHAVPHRGTLMGNRGTLHNASQAIVRQWARKPWVTCLLSYKGIKRTPFSAGNYSELFFLDEATSLAAGHRPCKTCQRDKHVEFKKAWLTANMPEAKDAFVPISDIDDVLHSERVRHGGIKRTFTAAVSELPVGTMFEHEGAAFLVGTNGLLLWSFEGYSKVNSVPSHAIVDVLTPESVMRMFGAGYQPEIHESARA